MRLNKSPYGDLFNKKKPVKTGFLFSNNYFLLIFFM